MYNKLYLLTCSLDKLMLMFFTLAIVPLLFLFHYTMIKYFVFKHFYYL